MRTLLIFSLLVVGLAVSSQAQTAQVTLVTSAQCGMCKSRLERDMLFTPGVKKVVLDLETKGLTVWYNAGKVDLEGLRKAVNRIGYDADASPADPAAYEKLPACCKKGGMDHE